jgi:hypothetical protein
MASPRGPLERIVERSRSAAVTRPSLPSPGTPLRGVSALRCGRLPVRIPHGRTRTSPFRHAIPEAPDRPEACRACATRPSLRYLSRYLYRGVLSERDIIANADGQVSFRYTDSKTGKRKIRRLAGAEFLWQLLQHVLPRGFRRTRDFGILHHRRKVQLTFVQLLLGVRLAPTPDPVRKKPLRCRHCGGILHIVAVLSVTDRLKARLRPASAAGSIAV